MNYNRKKKTLIESINTSKGGMCQIRAFVKNLGAMEKKERSKGQRLMVGEGDCLSQPDALTCWK